MHGMIMILATISFFIGPFGNFIVPIMIGARDMAFPRLNALSIALLIPGLVIFLFTPFLGLVIMNGQGGGVQTGWTLYAPLADQTGIGMTSLAAGVVLIGASSIMGAVNVVTTVMTMRTRGMTWTRLPMTVWGIMGAALLAAIGTSSFSADLVLIILDRAYKTSFFFYQVGGDAVGAGGGNAWLAQNLFWFFGHPEVYLIVLPAFGIVIDILVVFGRKPLFGYKTAVLGIMGVVVLSFLVWAHHEFVSGWAPEIRPFYMATTEMISIPTGLVFLVALGTLWRGRLWMTTAMLFALSFIWNFLIGGISGIFLSDVPADVQLHGGMFVTAHFHFTMVGGALMGFFAAVYFWFPKMTGRMYNEALGKLHFWLTFVGFNLTFFPMHYLGIQGMPRRVADYAPRFADLNLFISIASFGLGASTIVFVYNMVTSWRFGARAPANPWRSMTLEWQVSSPPPIFNFDEIPQVVGNPYEYGVPGARHAILGVPTPAPVPDAVGAD
jgi:cytochrome c oxidase subunit 1